MTTPVSPKLLKGALVSFLLPDPRPRIVAFQYNPASLTRTLEAQTAAGDGAESEATILRGAPIEQITLEAELDATDGLAEGDAETVRLGLHPQLAALELLVYPSTAVVLANTALLAAGTIEIVPPVGPFTLFVWGPRRILPVRLTQFSITEEAYDPRLNPIRATVSLGLRVLSYNDLPVTHPGYHLFLAHQLTKEAMAVTTDSLAAVVGNGVRVL
jgi:hypothetical protein